MRQAFRVCNNINNSTTNFNDWDVSNIEDFGFIFANSPFNQQIDSWNTANVTNMERMFAEVSEFNPNIGGWNTANVTNMVSMFINAASFNQDLSGWCVEQIPTQPSGFDTGATSWVLPKPNWGAPC
jgi:surface protein